MVQAMDAFKRPIVCERSVRANTRVLAYMQNRRTAPAKARIRFAFFIRIILYIQSRL